MANRKFDVIGAELETLERRQLLAAHIWTGAASSLWSDPANWQGGAPSIGEADLRIEFPAGAQRFNSTNDIGLLDLSELVIGAGSYSISGSPLRLSGGVQVDLKAGHHRIDNDLQLTGSARFDITGASSSDGLTLTLGGRISGSADLVKYGHNLRLIGDNTYTGQTRIEGGGIRIDGNQPQSNIIVESGLVSGSGVVGSIVFGDSFGSLGVPVQPNSSLVFEGLPHITGNLTLTEHTYFRPNLGVPGGTLRVDGTVQLNGAQLAAVYETPPAPGQTFILIDNAGTDPINGTFAGLAEGAEFMILDRLVKITYSGGDGNDVAVTVQGEETRTVAILTPSATVVLPGQSVFFDVKVETTFPTGITPGGVVALFQDDVKIAQATLDANGTARFEVTSLPLRGSSRFHVTYSGQPAQNLLPTRSEDQRVRVILSGQTETQLYIAPPSAFAGESSLLVARVIGLGIPEGTPTGSVTFFIDGEPIATRPLDADGRATFTTAAFPVGNARVRAVYSGDGTFTQSAVESSRLTRLIDGRYFPTVSRLTATPARSNIGEAVTLTAVIEKAPGRFDATLSGFVSFYAGDALLGKAALRPDGRAILVVSDLPVGSHELRAVYDGNESYASSESVAVPHEVVGGPQLQAVSGARLAAVTDMDGDGNADLVWRNESTGQNFIQYLDASANVTFTRALLDMTDYRWRLEGAADFNGDGHGDLVWRNQETGRILMWKIVNGQVRGIMTVQTSPVAPGWRIVGTGDFNNDGFADLAWRNDTTGQAVVWNMRANGVRKVQGLGPVARNLQWTLETVFDVNKDGRPDLIWRNTSTGAVAAWLMRGTAFVSFNQLGRIAGDGWEIAGVNDLDHDGEADILFRNITSGELRTWTIDPASVA